MESYKSYPPPLVNINNVPRMKMAPTYSFQLRFFCDTLIRSATTSRHFDPTKRNLRCFDVRDLTSLDMAHRSHDRTFLWPPSPIPFERNEEEMIQSKDKKKKKENKRKRKMTDRRCRSNKWYRFLWSTR